MPDGPNIEKLFTETDCLTALSNLDEICKYLRFFKNEGTYQMYLAKYLPKLAKPEYKAAFDEFIGDVEDKKLAAEFKKAFAPAKKELVETPVEVTPPPSVEIPVETVKKPKKKTS